MGGDGGRGPARGGSTARRLSARPSTRVALVLVATPEGGGVPVVDTFSAAGTVVSALTEQPMQGRGDVAMAAELAFAGIIERVGGIPAGIARRVAGTHGGRPDPQRPGSPKCVETVGAADVIRPAARPGRRRDRARPRT